MFWVLVLAAAAANAAPAGAPGFESYRGCIAQAVKKAADTEETPEDLVVALPNACTTQRGASPDGRVRQLLSTSVRRYAIFYSTGVWVKE